MKKYMCRGCGYIYEPALGDKSNGIAEGGLRHKNGLSCRTLYYGRVL
ncbi:MAG: rubredoxin [Nitrospirae bacterium]|nr:rubredoxin [Nitrospirota bacterium]